MNTGIKEFIVGDTAYKFTELAPVEALSFGTKVAKTIGPILGSVFAVLGNVSGGGDKTAEFLEAVVPALDKIDEAKLEALLKECFGHVYTPANENLGDEAAFNSWFQDHKADLFPVGLTALFNLSKDFFPRLSDIRTPN